MISCLAGVLALGACAEMGRMMDSLSRSPALYYGAAHSAASQGDHQAANAYQTFGDLAAYDVYQDQSGAGGYVGGGPAKMAYVYGVPTPGTPYGRVPNVVWGANAPGNAAYVHPSPGYVWATADPGDLTVVPAR